RPGRHRRPGVRKRCGWVTVPTLTRSSKPCKRRVDTGRMNGESGDRNTSPTERAGTMYYDHDGHAIATPTADAASTLTAHEQAAYFGYDCYCPACAAMDAIDTETEAAELARIHGFTS